MNAEAHWKFLPKKQQDTLDTFEFADLYAREFTAGQVERLLDRAAIHFRHKSDVSASDLAVFLRACAAELRKEPR